MKSIVFSLAALLLIACSGDRSEFDVSLASAPGQPLKLDYDRVKSSIAKGNEDWLSRERRAGRLSADDDIVRRAGRVLSEALKIVPVQAEVNVAVSTIPRSFVAVLPIAFTGGGYDYLVVSEYMMRQLDDGELKYYFTHELAHLELGHPFTLAVVDLVMGRVEDIYNASQKSDVDVLVRQADQRAALRRILANEKEADERAINYLLLRDPNVCVGAPDNAYPISALKKTISPTQVSEVLGKTSEELIDVYLQNPGEGMHPFVEIRLEAVGGMLRKGCK